MRGTLFSGCGRGSCCRGSCCCCRCWCCCCSCCRCSSCCCCSSWCFPRSCGWLPLMLWWLALMLRGDRRLNLLQFRFTPAVMGTCCTLGSVSQGTSPSSEAPRGPEPAWPPAEDHHQSLRSSSQTSSTRYSCHSRVSIPSSLSSCCAFWTSLRASRSGAALSSDTSTSHISSPAWPNVLRISSLRLSRSASWCLRVSISVSHAGISAWEASPLTVAVTMLTVPLLAPTAAPALAATGLPVSEVPTCTSCFRFAFDGLDSSLISLGSRGAPCARRFASGPTSCTSPCLMDSFSLRTSMPSSFTISLTSVRERRISSTRSFRMVPICAAASAWSFVASTLRRWSTPSESSLTSLRDRGKSTLHCLVDERAESWTRCGLPSSFSESFSPFDDPSWNLPVREAAVVSLPT
mmetsp:Transcript_91388/g.258829  ORF Transcript_91388/g.258829 Transcript_91388/m.258829 type:complete len:406 (-) Transcript_91388:438-1655(-)